MCDTGQSVLDKPFVCPQERDREGVIPGESNGCEGDDACNERREGELDPKRLDDSRPGSRPAAVADRRVQMRRPAADGRRLGLPAEALSAT